MFEVLDRVGEHGGDGSNQYTSANTKDFVLANDNASAKRTAKLIGTSDVQVTKMRTILDYASDDYKNQTLNLKFEKESAEKTAKLIGIYK